MRRLCLILALGIPLLALAGGIETILGHILFALGQTRAAAQFLQDPAWKGYALASSHRYLEAAEAFGDAPANAFNRGNALALAHHYHEAIDAYDDALESDPEDEDAQFNKDLIVKLLAGGAVDGGQSRTSANATANKEHHAKATDESDGDTSSSGNGYTGDREASSMAGGQGSSKVSKPGNGGGPPSGSTEGKASGMASVGGDIGRSGGNLAEAFAAMQENQRKVLRDRTNGFAEPTQEWLQTLHDDPGEYLKLMIRAEQMRRVAHAPATGGDDD